MNIKKYNTKFILFEIIVIMLGIIGVTFAASYIMKSINIDVDTASLAVNYTGTLTLPKVDLVPIEDSSVYTNTDNVMRINFTVKGASSNPNIPIIYDVILSDLEIDNELRSEYLKWELKKNGSIISKGSFDPYFDALNDGKLWLTEIQQDLPTSSQSADNYEFILWISESCTEDITTCTEEMDQSNMLGKKISGKIETVLYTKSKEGLVRMSTSYASDYIASLLDSNPNTMNDDDPDGNVRYMGSDPNNYVKFNNELWRIIGVFNVASTYGGGTEKRLKIIRDESIGNYSWDNKTSGVGSTTSNYGSNDWTDSTLMEMLNNGPYWNRMSGLCPTGVNGENTSCDFSANGLTLGAKRLIEDAVWNLGGSGSYNTSSTGLANHWYGYERGTAIYGNKPTYWIGKIGLVYPSDYGYATGGGSKYGHNKCLSVPINWCYQDEYVECNENNYLQDLSFHQWTITNYAYSNNLSFCVNNNGGIYCNLYVTAELKVFPVLYLKNDVLIIDGDGTKLNPYILR